MKKDKVIELINSLKYSLDELKHFSEITDNNELSSIIEELIEIYTILEMSDDEFSEFLISKLNSSNCDDISKMLISGSLSSDENKGIILDKIYGMFARKEDDSIKKQNELLKNICMKIFNSVNLRDEGTKRLLSPFFYYFPELKEKKIDVIDYWMNAVKYNYRNAFKLWDSELLKEEMTELNLSGYNIGPVGVKLIASL